MRTRTAAVATLTTAVALLAAGLVSGCSSSSEESAEAAPVDPRTAVALGPRGASGTRLRAKLVTGGGARELLGFFDTARNEDCAFQRTADGRLRCLPRFLQGFTGSTFADATCKVPLAAVTTSCTAGFGYVATISAGGCSSTAGVATIRPVVRFPSESYVSAGGVCQARSPSNGATATAVEVGEPIPLDQFVAAEEVATTTDGLTERVAVATDGARLTLGHRVAALDVDCTFEVMADGVTRCVPEAVDTQLLYTDSSCSRAGFTFPIGTRTCGPDGSLVREKTRSGCGATRAIHSVASGVDAPVPEGDLYQSSTSASGAWCTTSSRSASGSPLRALTDITASLPQVARVGAGSGRLVPALVPRGAGEDLVPGFHDTERDVDCAFAKAKDGKIRCLPTGPRGAVFFTDASCTSPARVGAAAGAVSCADGASRFVRVDRTDCNAGPAPLDAVTIRVFELGGVPRNLSGGSWESAPGRCSRMQTINGVVDATEIDPSGFVEGTIVTE